MKWGNVVINIGDHPVDRYIEYFLEFDLGNKPSKEIRERIRSEIKRQIKNSFVLTAGQLKKLGVKLGNKKKHENIYHIAYVQEREGRLFAERIYIVNHRESTRPGSKSIVIVCTVLSRRIKSISNVRGGSFAQKLNIEGKI